MPSRGWEECDSLNKFVLFEYDVTSSISVEIPEAQARVNEATESEVTWLSVPAMIRPNFDPRIIISRTTNLPFNYQTFFLIGI
jgi:hypothetical protein